MMPYGNGPGGMSAQCGCGPNQGFNQWFGGAPTWGGTFAPGFGFANPGMGFGGPGMGWGGPSMGFGGQGMGFGGPAMGFGGPGMGFGGPGMGNGAAGFGGFGPGAGQFGNAGMGFGANFDPVAMGWGLGGLRRWGGNYTPQFMLTGLPTDDEITEMVYDALDADPMVPYDADINVDSDAGTVTLTGTVPTKEMKHAAGDDAWWIPGVDDVHNNLQVTPRRVMREQSGTETQGNESQSRQTARPTTLRTSEHGGSGRRPQST